MVNGAVHVVDGKIDALAPGLGVPAGARVVDLGDAAVLMPGLVDAASTLGTANEQTTEVTPDFRVLAEIDVEGTGFAEALRQGVTTVYVPPGTRNVVGGRGAVLRTAGEKRVLRRSAEISVSFGRDAAIGNRADLRRRPPVSIFYRRPGSRMGVNAAMRAFFATSTAKAGPLRALVRTQRDLRTALRIAAEHGVRLILEDATAAATVASEIAAAGFPVVLGAPPGLTASTSAAEGAEQHLAVAAALERAGATIAFGTRTAGGRVTLRESALLAHRYGLSREAALRAITLEAATASGVADRVGSLAPGKDADLVAFSGDPLDPTSRVLLVVVEGRIVFDGRATGDGR
jgi:imidazolonepropionase-like amidohydrolase